MKHTRVIAPGPKRTREVPLPACLTAALVGPLLALGIVVGMPSVAAANASVALYVNGAFGGTPVAGCASPSNPCKTISAGVAAAEALSDSNVTLQVAAGTYAEQLSINVPATDSLVIAGAGAPTTTINDGGTGTVISVTGGIATVKGMTIAGGSAATGGGVSTAAPSLVTLADDVISGNTATGNGGGVYVGGTATLTGDTISNDTTTGPSVSDGGGVYVFGIATLSGDTLDSDTAAYEGGAVYGDGPLTMSNDSLTSDTARLGGGVYAFSDDLTISRSTFSMDDDSAGYGVLFVSDGLSVMVSDTVFTNNADRAIYLNLSPATFTDDTISNNTSPIGAGVEVEGLGTNILDTFTDDTFSDNAATNCGGGLDNVGGIVDVSNSTFANNVSSLQGGAICSGSSGFNSVTNLEFDTFASNSAIGSGGAIESGLGEPFTVASSLFSGNIAGTSPSCSGAVTDDGRNVADDSSCAFGVTSVSDSSTIGSLALTANGSTGPQTAAISAGSSAFGEVPPSACTVTQDERGLPRPGAGAGNCDAGAYELQKLPQVITFTPPGPGAFGSSEVLHATGGGSGNEVLFGVSSSSGRGVCRVVASAVFFASPGICVVAAQQAGNNFYQPAPIVKRNIVVSKETSTSLLSVSKTRTTAANEHSERLSAAVTPEFAHPAATGTVLVRTGSKQLCRIVLSAGRGSCLLPARSLRPGSYRVVATYVGNQGVRASTSPGVTLHISR